MTATLRRRAEQNIGGGAPTSIFFGGGGVKNRKPTVTAVFSQKTARNRLSSAEVKSSLRSSDDQCL
jgi:hypothetical protein